MSAESRVAKALKKSSVNPSVKIDRFNGTEDLIEVELEMERRGYLFASWINHRVVTYRYAPEEIKKEKQYKTARNEADYWDYMKYLMRGQRNPVYKHGDGTSILLWPDRIQIRDAHGDLCDFPTKGFESFSCARRSSDWSGSSTEWDVVLVHADFIEAEILGYWGDTYSDDAGDPAGFVVGLRALGIPQVDPADHEIYHQAGFTPG